jgi:hypothetical protein
LPSVQALPFAFAGLEQVPVAVLQLPASWHWSLAVQLTGLLPTHAPAWQESLRVQALPSLQATPLVTAGCWQAPSMQRSVVQTLPSSQPASALHSKPVSKAKRESLPSWMFPPAATAPDAIRRAPARTVARDRTRAFTRASLPSVRPPVAPAPATTKRSAPAASVPAGARRTRSPPLMRPATRTLDAASALISASLPSVRFWN